MEDPYYDDQFYQDDALSYEELPFIFAEAPSYEEQQFEEEFVSEGEFEEEFVSEGKFEEEFMEEEPEFRSEVKVAERTSKIGVRTQFISRSVYLQTRTNLEVATDEIQRILDIYIENKSNIKYRTIRDQLINLNNIHLYNPLLMVVAALFNYDYPKFLKANFNKFINDYDTQVSKEDLIRYIRLVRFALGVEKS